MNIPYVRNISDYGRYRLVEQSVRHLLWYIAIFGSFTSTIFLGMVVVASVSICVERAEWNESSQASASLKTCLL